MTLAAVPSGWRYRAMLRPAGGREITLALAPSEYPGGINADQQLPDYP